MNFQTITGYTLGSMGAIAVGGVLACIGVARGPKWLAYAGVALAVLGLLVFIIAFIRAWRTLRREQKKKGGPER